MEENRLCACLVIVIKSAANSSHGMAMACEPKMKLARIPEILKTNFELVNLFGEGEASNLKIPLKKSKEILKIP
jgi:hypothetical protein